MDTKPVLLVWEEHPETIRYFLLEVTPEQEEVLDIAHGHMLGCEDDPIVNEALDKVNMAVSSEEHCTEMDSIEGWDSIWYTKEINVIDLPRLSVPIQSVYTCGFMC